MLGRWLRWRIGCRWALFHKLGGCVDLSILGPLDMQLPIKSVHQGWSIKGVHHQGGPPSGGSIKGGPSSGGSIFKGVHHQGGPSRKSIKGVHHGGPSSRRSIKEVHLQGGLSSGGSIKGVYQGHTRCQSKSRMDREASRQGEHVALKRGIPLPECARCGFGLKFSFSGDPIQAGLRSENSKYRKTFRAYFYEIMLKEVNCCSQQI